MIDAHSEQTSPTPKTANAKPDPEKDLKQSLIGVLNSKASLEDLQQLKYDKTNKTDTDMQMKSIDIMQKQMVQLSTVILELIK